MNYNPKCITSTVPKCNIELDAKNPTKEMVFELIRHIKDPEHPYSLETLNVVSIDSVIIENISTKYNDGLRKITILFQPTIPHCSMAAIIGLCIFHVVKSKLDTFWISVKIIENTHINWHMLNKQLNDKDRVNAALENTSILDIVHDCTFI